MRVGPKTRTLNSIQKNRVKANPVNQTNFRHYSETQFAILITRGWIDLFISQYQIELIETRSTSQDEPRRQ
jgi:hypothetical protein